MRFTHNSQQYVITDDRNRGYRITERGLWVLDTVAAFRAYRKEQDELDALAVEMDERNDAQYWAQPGHL